MSAIGDIAMGRVEGKLRTLVWEMCTGEGLSETQS